MTAELESRHCPRCGDPLAGAELSGNCLRCLATMLLSPESADAVKSSPTPFLCQLGDYELLEEVARGGMGVVFRARQLGLDRIVAIKVLRDAWLATPVQVKRFQAEAANAAKLKHPNIVAVHEVGEQAGQHYFAMDLVEGKNLAEATREGPLPPRRAAELARKVAEAVQHAHQQGVLHRDVKPSNVLLDTQGEPHVTDFGLARPMDDESSLTLTGQVLGTPGYMSPEQAKGGATVGPASDVYGLGSLLFHLLTGRAPFVGASAAETLTQVLQQEPLSPRLLNPAVPADLAAVCLKCLGKLPRERYGSAGELAADLARFLGNETTHARPAGPVERGARWCRRKPALAATVIVLHVVGVLGLAGILWQWRRAEREAHTAREELWHSQLMEARSYRLNGGPGQRIKTLEAIKQAAAYRPSVELRNEALAALVLPDLGSNVWWHSEDNAVIPQSCTHDLQFFAYALPGGNVAVRRGQDQTLVVELEGLGTSPVYSWFSPDDRWLAIRFADGAVGVWDWRERRLLFRAASLPGEHSVPTFDFTPDGRELWLFGRDSRLRHYTTAEGRLLPAPSTDIRGEGMQLDRSGRRLLTVDHGRVSVWDVTSATRLGDWVTTNRVYCLTWHPDGEHFVLGLFQNGLFAGEVGRPELSLLEGSTGNGVVHTKVVFTPDGDHLLACGWSDYFGVWDSATRRLALEGRDAGIGQVNRAGTMVTVWQDQHGYGVRQFLNPVGVRRMRLPALFGSGARTAAWHPGGRWLVAGQELGWTLWDTANGRLVDQRQGGVSCQVVQFLPTGGAFVTGGGDGPQLWPFDLVGGRPRIGEPRLLLPVNAGAIQRTALSPDGKHFATVGLDGAFIGTVSGESQPVPIPGGAGNGYVSYSTDGQWIRIHHYRGKTVQFHSAATGDLITNLPTGGSANWFVPGRNELLAHGPSELTWWQLGTWRLLRRMTSQERRLPDEPIGFWPDGSCALVNGRDNLLRLWELEAGQEIATLRLPEGSAAWGGVFDPSGARMLTTGGFLYFRIWDVVALRRELRELGLDWPDAEPGRGFIAANGNVREQ